MIKKELCEDSVFDSACWAAINPFPDVAGYIRHGHMRVFKKIPKNTVLNLAP